MTDLLLIDRQIDRWTFTLNRPEKRNAMSSELIESLISGVDAAHTEGIPLLVFNGTGKNFSAGFDFSHYEEQSDGDLVLRMIRIETLLQKVASSPSLTVALAQGRNFGAGVDLFATCKLRYCTPEASFRMPGLKFGLVLGSRRFRHLVGVGPALSILSSARSFDAQEALNIGFVDQTTSESDWPLLLDQATEIANALDATTRANLYRILDVNSAHLDMAELVNSASRPDLKSRIRQYLGD